MTLHILQAAWKVALNHHMWRFQLCISRSLNNYVIRPHEKGASAVNFVFLHPPTHIHTQNKELYSRAPLVPKTASPSPSKQMGGREKADRNQSYGKKEEVWKGNLNENERRRREQEERKKTCLGNENTKAEVQVVDVKQCHGSEWRRCAGKNDSTFDGVDNKIYLFEGGEGCSSWWEEADCWKVIQTLDTDDSWKMGWVI